MKETILNLTNANVIKAYSGKPGCRCGCNGAYWYTTANRELGGTDRGYPVADTEVSDERVATILNIVQYFAEKCEYGKYSGGGFADVNVNGRDYTVYFTL